MQLKLFLLLHFSIPPHFSQLRTQMHFHAVIVQVREIPEGGSSGSLFSTLLGGVIFFLHFSLGEGSLVLQNIELAPSRFQLIKFSARTSCAPFCVILAFTILYGNIAPHSNTCHFRKQMYSGVIHTHVTQNQPPTGQHLHISNTIRIPPSAW